MGDEIRIVRCDSQLGIEAYLFHGIMQKFPNHFHEHYVIGYIEKGHRKLTCAGTATIVNTGDVLLLHPGEPHTCEQVDDRPLDFRCLNIPPEIMARTARELGRDGFRSFSQNVLRQSELVESIRELHQKILRRERDFRKEECFLLLLDQLIEEYGHIQTTLSGETGLPEIDSVCAYLDTQYDHTISLDELSQIAGLSKYHLLRTFTRQKGITPYGYLETVRVGKAKKLLESGVPPADAALMAGFTDQSHFSNFFKRLIGLTPKQYMRAFQEAAEDRQQGAARNPDQEAVENSDQKSDRGV